MEMPNGAKPKAKRLDSISKKYVHDNELRDAPARLFRAILNTMEMSPKKWAGYLRRYLDWVITTEDRDKARNERIHQIGNLKDAFFQKPTLTFNKMLEGLSIIEQEECEIIIRVKDAEGKVIEVSEHFTINNAVNQPKDK